MANYRIIKTKGYQYLCDLEKQTYWGSWYKLMHGSEEECLEGLKRLRETGSLEPTIHTESF